MESHTYQLHKKTVGNLLLTSLAFLGLTLLANLFAHISYQSAPPQYLEDIVIAEKSHVALHPPGQVDFLFVGDSSCLMGVSTPVFEQLTSTLSYNLGTLSTLGLEKFGEFTADFLQRNSRANPTIVILINPEMVRSGSVIPSRSNDFKLKPADEIIVRNMREESRRAEAELRRLDHSILSSVLPIQWLKTNVVARLVELPYPGSFGFIYGFPRGVQDRLVAEKGSAIDPSGSDSP
jgi:hypothetical protein